jgi:SAM-dependent methyltransferase
MARTKPFDTHLPEYEDWFDANHFVYLSELEAIREVIPAAGKGVEIGIGSGLFASPLGISEGCDPSIEMRKKAAERGLHAIEGIAENLPYEAESFDFALMVTTICFVDDAMQTYHEINRILKPGGTVITGFVDKNSPVGKQYLTHKEESIFYRDATFFGTDDIIDLLTNHDFTITKIRQTVFGTLEDITAIQYPENGYGKGSFVVIQAKKK